MRTPDRNYRDEDHEDFDDGDRDSLTDVPDSLGGVRLQKVLA